MQLRAITLIILIAGATLPQLLPVPVMIIFIPIQSVPFHQRVLVQQSVNGIVVTAGTTKNVYQNSISGLKANLSNQTGNVQNAAVNGIWVSGGTTVNVYQNTIFGCTRPTLLMRYETVLLYKEELRRLFSCRK